MHRAVASPRQAVLDVLLRVLPHSEVQCDEGMRRLCFLNKDTRVACKNAGLYNANEKSGRCYEKWKWNVIITSDLWDHLEKTLGIKQVRDTTQIDGERNINANSPSRKRRERCAKWGAKKYCTLLPSSR